MNLISLFKMKNQKKLEKLKSIAKLLDSQFEGPFRIKYGLDGVLGFIPGLGDFITTCASLYLLIASARLGCGPAVLIRMGFNIAIENIFDMVPLIGNLFDFYWKSNLKNIDLLEKHLANPKREATYSNLLVVFIVMLLILLLFSTVYFSFIVLKTIYISLLT